MKKHSITYCIYLKFKLISVASCLIIFFLILSNTLVSAQNVFYASTALQLYQKLDSARNGDTVIVSTNIDVTGYDSLKLRRGVTMKGNYSLFGNASGVEISSTDFFHESKGVPVFMMDTLSRITNLRFRGPLPEYKDYVYDTIYDFSYTPDSALAGPLEGVSLCVTTVGYGTTISDCEFYGWDKWALRLYNPNNARVEKCWIHHSLLGGFGYGMWIQGKGGTKFDCNGDGFTNNKDNMTVDQGTAYVSHCVLGQNREDIDGQAGRFSYIVDNCTFSEFAYQENMARHGTSGSDGGWMVINGTDTIMNCGGDSTVVKNCRFYKTGRVVAIAHPNTNCNGMAKLIVKDNQFENGVSCQSPYIAVNGPHGIDDYCMDSLWAVDTSIIVSNNSIDGSFIGAPTAKIKAINTLTSSVYGDTAIVYIGDTITFLTDSCKNGSGTYGSTRMRYCYRFNDKSEFYVNDTIVSGSVKHAFTEAGLFNVTLLAIDSPFTSSKFAHKAFFVKPNDCKIHLITYVKDNHRWSNLSGTDSIYKVVKFNDSIVWSSSISGAQGWERVDVDITNLILSDALKDTIRFELQVRGNTDATRVRGTLMWFDDVYINKPNGDNLIRYGDFEGIDTTGYMLHNYNWGRNNVPIDSAGLATNKKVKVVLDRQDTYQRSGRYSASIALTNLQNHLMWPGRYYFAGSYGRFWQSISYPVSQVDTTVVKLKEYIEGYYNGSNQLTSVLYNAGVPSNQTLCDTVKLSLRDTIPPYHLRDSAIAVLDTSGRGTFVFCNLLRGGSFYLVAKHQNALETWSALPVTLSSDSTTYDFTTANTKAYGNNMVNVATGKWAFYSGDINLDGSIDAFDFIPMDADIQGGVTGYHSTDLDGDGAVTSFDFLILDPNIQSNFQKLTPP